MIAHRLDALLVAVAILGCSCKPSAPAPLDESVAEKGYVAHYSKDFTVAYHDNGVVILSRSVGLLAAEERLLFDASPASDADAKNVRRAAESSIEVLRNVDEKRLGTRRARRRLTVQRESSLVFGPRSGVATTKPWRAIRRRRGARRSS